MGRVSAPRSWGTAGRIALPALLTAALALSGCGEGDNSEASTHPDTAAAPRDTAASRSDKTAQAPRAEAGHPGCKRVKAPQRRPFAGLNAPKQTVAKGDRMVARVKTTCGTFEIALETRWSPKTVNSFASLARRGLYEGLAFTRVGPRSVLQGGAPFGSGAGGPGYAIDEKPPANFSYDRGIVAMAQQPPPAEPPGHSGSRFFVVMSDRVDLPAVYAPIGRVYAGFDVLRRIAGLATPSGKLRRPVLIEWIWAKKGQPPSAAHS